MNKKARANLQRDMDKVLANLDNRWISAASRELTFNLSKLLSSIPDTKVENVLAWISHFQGEADLSDLIDEQLSSKKVFLPRVIGKGEMEFVRINEGWEESFVRGYNNIPGPPAAKVSDIFDEDMAEKTLIIVPGIAFDSLGNWIGRSFGYYNKFLAAQHMRKAIKVGVCWSMQLIDQAPPDPYDVYLDYVCTEDKFISTEPSSAISGGEGRPS